MVAPKQFMFDDVLYYSHQAASIALGLSISTIHRYAAKGIHYSYQVYSPNKLPDSVIRYLQSGAKVDVKAYAKECGVAKSTIYRAVSGHTHNDGVKPLVRPNLSKSARAAIVENAGNLLQRELAELYGTTHSNISRIQKKGS